MLTVIIKDNGEPNVIKLTYENMWKELKDIQGAELLVTDNWLDSIAGVTTNYVCLVEADCLVNSGYFTSQLGLYKKDPFMRKLAVLSSSTAVNNWHNRIYGYSIGNDYSDRIVPNMDKKSKIPYPVEVAYIPGSILHVGMLKRLLTTLKADKSWQEDLVFLSTQLSLGFWRQGIGNGVGNRVHLNPNATYVTTEDYINDIAKFEAGAEDLMEMFRTQTI